MSSNNYNYNNSNNNSADDDVPATEMIKTLRNLSKVEIDTPIPPSGVLLYGLDGAEIRSEPSRLVPNKTLIHRVYLRYGNYKIGWIIDNDVEKCLICNTSFGVFVRRHHCRNCGYVVCDNCSPHRAIIRQLKNESNSIFAKPESRVCSVCATKHRLNEIWDATPPSSPAPSPSPLPSLLAPAQLSSTQSSPSSILRSEDNRSLPISNSGQSTADIPQTPQEQPTNPSQYQFSDPVPINLFPIINEEVITPIEEKDGEQNQNINGSQSMTVNETPESPLPSNPSTISPTPQVEVFTPSIHAFSVDDNDGEEATSEDESSPRDLINQDTDSPVLTPAPRPARRASWLEQKLGITLQPFSSEAEVKDEENSDKEKEGEGGIDSESDEDNGSRGSSASGESVNSSRLSSRKSSRSKPSQSIRMTRTSDTYDEDSNLSSDYFTSPQQSPSSTSIFSSPQSFSSPNETQQHEPITINQLKLHSEQQRLIQLDQERKAEKLKQQQLEKERVRREQEGLTTPVKSNSSNLGDSPGLSPPVSSASSSSPASGTLSSSSPSPSPIKRRSSLMWFFGGRDSGKETTKPSPIMRRGSDPGLISARNSEERRDSLTRDNSITDQQQQQQQQQHQLPTNTPPLVATKSLPL